jgi:hypothetical protein
MKVANQSDLAKLRHWVARHKYDDERLANMIVTLLSNGATVRRIVCASDDLAWDGYRIAAGLRFRLEDGAAEWAASELAGTDEPLALAA